MSVQDPAPFKTRTVEIDAVAPGSLFAGRYEILEELGRGGMGVVLKARDTRLERDVALKFLPAGLVSNPESKARFLREARTAAALDHPNICPVYEVDEAEGKIFISMAFIAGESLKIRIERGPLDLRLTLDIVRQIAEGLKAAHERGIVHRDIKPANIMITPDGQARITDFGLAKTSGGMFLTRVGTTVGTIAYMSPEQARGEDVDRRTDLWSLGVVLYECLTGRLPFKGDQDRVVLNGILHERPLPLSEAGPAFPRQMEDIVRLALKKRDRERYQTADEMLADLASVRTLLAAGPVGTSPRWLSLLFRRRLPRSIGLYVLLSAVILAAAHGAVKRFVLSPYLPDFILAILLAMLPTVVLLSFRPGIRAGRSWDLARKIAIPVNLAAAAGLLILLFSGKNLGAATRTVRLTNEDGRTVERIIPRSEFRKKLQIFFFDNETGDPKLDWLQYALPYLVLTDLSQDLFLDVRDGYAGLAKMKEAGFPLGVKLPFTLKMKISGDLRLPNFVSASLARSKDGLFIAKTTLYDTKKGRPIADRRIENESLFALADGLSARLKEDLGIPSGHIEEARDLPIAEITTNSLPALELFTDGLNAEFLQGDWARSLEALDRAADADPTFAAANAALYAAAIQANKPDLRARAIRTLMKYLYKMPERDQYMVKSVYFFDKNEPARRLAVVKMMAEVFPDDVQSHVLLADVYSQQGLWDESLAESKRVLEIDPDQTGILKEIGAAYSRKGDLKTAFDYYERYAAHFPNEYEAQARVAEILVKLGSFEKAKSQYEKALTVDPGNIQGRLPLARLEMTLGRYDRAEAMFLEIRKDIKVDGERTRVDGELAALYETRGRLRKALEYNLLALAESSPSSPPFQTMTTKLGFMPLYVKTGQRETARADIEAAKKQLPSPLDKIGPILELSYRLAVEDIAGAEEALRAAKATMDALPFPALKSGVFHGQGRLQEMKGEYAAAIESFAEESKYDPGNLKTILMTARCRRLLQEPKKAEEILQGVLQSRPFDPEARFELAQALWDLGRKDEARSHLTIALDAWTGADPDFQPALKARRKLADWRQD